MRIINNTKVDLGKSGQLPTFDSTSPPAKSEEPVAFSMEKFAAAAKL